MTEARNSVELKFYREIAESTEVEAFLTENAGEEESRLLLRHKEVAGVPVSLVVNQISGRRKAKSKIPTYAEAPGIVYPPGLNLEQSSSEKTADFKAKILAEASGATRRMADLTGGFGIDSFSFAKTFDSVEYIEPNKVLSWIAQHNHKILDTPNITYHGQTAEQFLDQDIGVFDAVYVDPSRRRDSGKVIRLRDCDPDIVNLQPRIFEIAPLLLIKASPLLDITAGLRELSCVCRIYVVSVDQECRELLFLCQQGFAGEPLISTIHLNKDLRETFDFTTPDEKSAGLSYGPVLKYLYEPNPSIMKAGAFRSVAQAFGIAKIHANSHFFTSDVLLTEFPGRIFEVISRIPGNGRDLERFLPGRKANVVVRNYPLSSDQLRKKLRLTDGGSDYVIGTTSLADGKLVLLAHRHK